MITQTYVKGYIIRQFAGMFHVTFHGKLMERFDYLSEARWFVAKQITKHGPNTA